MSYQINSLKYLNSEEETNLINTLSRYNTRDSLVLQALLKTGARASEILNVRVNDVNRVDGTVYIRGLKGSLNREIPLPLKLLNELYAYMDSIGVRGDDLVFPISYNRLQQIWDVYRPNRDKGLHSLRHTFAINLYKKSKDIRLVQTALGHKSITNTMVYATYLYTKDELKKALLF